jgi:hypothetical protein
MVIVIHNILLRMAWSSVGSLYIGAGAVQSLQCLATDWKTRVLSSSGGKDFSSSFCVQSSSESHPASYQMNTGVLSRGLKRGRGVTLTTHRHLVPRSRMSRSYTSCPPSAFVACKGTALHTHTHTHTYTYIYPLPLAPAWLSGTALL